MKRTLLLSALLFLLLGCGEPPTEQPEEAKPGSFGYDLEFLNEHVEVVLLTDTSGKAQVAVVPAYQGRVMTSTNGGKDGPSFGWINYELIESETFVPHINVFGGEDRFWLGPEGGQFSIFFAKDDPFDLEHWQTPPIIDTEPFDVSGSQSDESQSSVSFSREGSSVNYSGTQLNFRVDREIALLQPAQIASYLSVQLPSSVSAVAFQSENTLTNSGPAKWTKEGGMLSIWILGMYVPSPETAVIIPYEAGSEDDLGTIVNDNYFGKVPSERLVVEDKALYFKADGELRSKIGLTPQRALPVLGSWDNSRNVLTIVQYNKPQGVTDYVNSMWEIQEAPFSGDVVNSYNDGPPEPGAKPLGPFYELETSSRAANLDSGESLTHIHRTYHFTGERSELDRIAQAVLGVSIEEIPF